MKDLAIDSEKTIVAMLVSGGIVTAWIEPMGSALYLFQCAFTRIYLQGLYNV